MLRHAATLLLVGLSLATTPAAAEPAQYNPYPYPRPPFMPPHRPEPRAWFDVGMCLRYCDSGNPDAMEAFCRRSTLSGTRSRSLCWEAVNELEAGNDRGCRNRCYAIGGDRYYRP